MLCNKRSCYDNTRLSEACNFFCRKCTVYILSPVSGICKWDSSVDNGVLVANAVNIMILKDDICFNHINFIETIPK